MITTPINENHEQSYQEITEQANSTLEIMSNYEIPPEPKSYSIWYNYLSAKHNDLVKEMDKAIDQKVTFDQGINNYLYDKYIDPKDESHENTDNKTKQMLIDIIKSIGEFSGSNDSYQEDIDTHINILENINENDDITAVIQQVLQTVSALKRSSEEISGKLAKAKSEAETLRQELVKTASEAERDFLTGLFNRKALDKMLDNLTIHADREELPLCLMMVDIDHFKKFNDTYGHQIGDEVLKVVSKIFLDTLKGKDIASRYGGEEFAILLPATPMQGAMAVADIIRKVISKKELHRKDTNENYGKVTVSIGVSSYRHNKDTIHTFLKRADDALYQSKQKGRNRVTMEHG